VSAIALLLALFALLLGGFGARETVRSEADGKVARWVRAERLPPAAVPGARLFATSGCTACHTYLGTGSRNLGAPDLSAEGLRGRGIAWHVRHLTCPSCVVPGSPMPPFRALGKGNLRSLAVFLEHSRGRRR
jgi:cbb3-type cytochrome oxidase cytochrome c subunit